MTKNFMNLFISYLQNTLDGKKELHYEMKNRQKAKEPDGDRLCADCPFSVHHATIRKTDSG